LNFEVSSLFGVLVIDKPAGPTSHDVVAAARRALAVDRIGHTGTLDPLATGVLALVVGKATRLASLLTAGEKEYLARVRFGATSETYDAEPGAIRAGTGPAPADRDAIAAALPAFVGTYLQQPPPYSAKKVGGVPAYKLARRNKPVEIKPAQVTAVSLELVDYAEGVASLRLVCSSGFYVRSLAHELGQRLGCGAYLDGLIRTRAGEFLLADAVPLSLLVSDPAAAGERMIGAERLLPELRAVTLTDEGLRRVGHGNVLRGGVDFATELPADSVRGGGAPRVRLLDAGGALLGLGEPRPDGMIQPVVVLA
jgi:tRNA pseudouridine55 synthase